MKKNVGDLDGLLRTLLFIITLCYAVNVGGSAWPWVIPSAILLSITVEMCCPIFKLLNINTNKINTRSN